MDVFVFCSLSLTVQKALRLVAFGQFHTVLGMKRLNYTPKAARGRALGGGGMGRLPSGLHSEITVMAKQLIYLLIY